VRRRRAAKQRVWLGPGRYFCGCEWRIAHANTDSDSDSNGYSRSNGIVAAFEPNANANSDADCHCNSDSDAYWDSNAHSDSNCDFDLHAQTNADSAARANNEASPDTSASSLAARVSGRYSSTIGELTRKPREFRHYAGRQASHPVAFRRPPKVFPALIGRTFQEVAQDCRHASCSNYASTRVCSLNFIGVQIRNCVKPPRLRP
jgi:hypothetical protein